MALAWSLIECSRCGLPADDDLRAEIVRRQPRGWAQPSCPACGSTRWIFHPFDCPCGKHGRSAS